jgi:hypothetical protein
MSTHHLKHIHPARTTWTPPVDADRKDCDTTGARQDAWKPKGSDANRK